VDAQVADVAGTVGALTVIVIVEHSGKVPASSRFHPVELSVCDSSSVNHCGMSLAHLGQLD
jgi:hypothetical protein